MIFIFHYFLFSVGLSSILILLTLFLQTYAAASLSEIGVLLMAMPFVACLTKPLVCALADRQQNHKRYLIGCVTLQALGYGSLAVPPFFPDLIAQHGRLVWYADVIGIVVGYTAFGVAWSIGDALAVNAARTNGVPWGSYRAWGTAAWGVGGIIVGQINELPFLPKYVPALLLQTAALLLEALILACWSDADFRMDGADFSAEPPGHGFARPKPRPAKPEPAPEDPEGAAAAAAKLGGGGGSLSGSMLRNPQLVGAVANIFLEDIGGSIKSSLRMGNRRRAGLDELLAQHQLGPVAQQVSCASNGSPAANSTQTTSGGSLASSPGAETPAQPHNASGSSAGTLRLRSAGERQASWGKSALVRTRRALSRFDSLSAASGHVIVDDLSRADASPAPPRQQAMMMSSLASSASLSRAAAARALGFSQQSSVAAPAPAPEPEQVSGEPASIVRPQQTGAPDDLQLVLLKLIMKRDAKILKSLVMFTLLGGLLTVHVTYFFLHVERICRDQGRDFSFLAGIFLLCHSVCEVASFVLVVPLVVPRLGTVGALVACASMYFARYFYYGLFLESHSPYWAAPFECLHGLAYGIVYSLITELALECVQQVDEYLPELVERKVVPADMDPNELKLPLRATMQGIFSGAFDGLGNGIGCLAAGVYLDYLSFDSLWLSCAAVSLAIAVVYPLSEWRRQSHK